MTTQETQFYNFLYPEFNGIKYNREFYINNHSINPFKAEKWVNNFTDRNLALKLLKLVNHISWRDFKYNLLKCAKEIADKIKGQEYKFFYEKNKSTYFFSAITYFEVFKKSGFITEKDTINHIIVDDMIYTGTQIINYIDEIIGDRILKDNIYDKKMYMVVEPRYKEKKEIYKNKLDLLNVNEYFIMYNRNQGITFYTNNLIMEVRVKNYGIAQIINLINDLQKIYGNMKFRQVFEEYPSTEEIYIYNLDAFKTPLVIYLCIPYISGNFLVKLEKIKSPGINIIMPPNTIYTDTVANTDIYKDNMDIQEFFSFDRLIDPKRMSPYYFDHKIAGPISTISSYIGCGIIPPYYTTTTDFIILGSLLNNCISIGSLPIEYQKEMEEYARSYINTIGIGREYDQDKDAPICGNCPFPVYKYQNNEFPTLEEVRQLNKKFDKFEFIYFSPNKIIVQEDKI